MNTSPMPHYTEMNNVVQERNYPHLSFSLLSFIYTQNVMDCKIVKITTYLVLYPPTHTHPPLLVVTVRQLFPTILPQYVIYMYCISMCFL